MTLSDIFDTPWGVDTENLAPYQWVFPTTDLIPTNYDFGTHFTSQMCPLCTKTLNILDVDLSALVKGDDKHVFDKNTKKKMKYHCDRYHKNHSFWPLLMSKYDLKDETVSVLFFAQKLLSSGANKFVLWDLADFKAYLSLVFGFAIGMLKEQMANKTLGSNNNERSAFLEQVEIFLDACLKACMEFQ